MAEQILDSYEAKISELSLLPSRGGVFEVSVDGALLFSKVALKRHAEPEEVLAAIASGQAVTG